MHAFRSNGRGQIEFWRLSTRASSYTPPLCKFSCSQASGDALTDVENYYNYVLGHTWDVNYDNGGPQEYKQTDTIDGSNFNPTAATADIDTDDYNGGLAPTWNNHLGYLVDPSTVSTSGADWDKTDTRAGIIAALDAVNWAALWAGSVIEQGIFQYDRYGLAFDASGRLPVTGGLPTGGTGSGTLLGYSGAYVGPVLELSGSVGDLGAFGRDTASVSDGVLGVGLVRTQIQIRNFHGAPIPYFIYETADVAASVFIPGTSSARGSVALASTNVFYRKVSEGTWTADRQIIQLPDAAMDGPQRITAPIGTKVRNGTFVSMVVGMTFEDWMLSILGPTWADYVFT